MAKRQFHGNVSSYLKVIDPNSLPHHQKSNISKLQIVGALKGSNLNYEFLTTLIKTMVFWKYHFLRLAIESVLTLKLNLLFKILTKSILILALLHRTRIFSCDCKGRRPKQFLRLLWRCASPRNLKFSPFCAPKISLYSEFCTFEDLQKQN